MTITDMALAKFDLLITDIQEKMTNETERKLDAIHKEAFFPSLQMITLMPTPSPLLLIFNSSKENEYRKSILRDVKIGSFKSLDGYSTDSFNNSITKVKAAKGFVNECKGIQRRAIKFVFWALFATIVDNADYDENISSIADFAQLLNIDEALLTDIILAIKVVLGEVDTDVSFQTDVMKSEFPLLLD